MDSEIEKLVKAVAAREGGAEDRLDDALTTLDVATVELIRELAGHEDPKVRIAAIRAASDRNEPELIEILYRLARDRDATVRHALASELRDHPGWRPAKVLGGLLTDESEEVRLPAVRAVGGDTEYTYDLLERLREDEDWEVRRAAAIVLERHPAEAALGGLLLVLGADGDREVSRSAGDSAESVFAAEGAWPEGAEMPALAILESARERLEHLGASRYPHLLPWVRDRVLYDVDPDLLAEFGVDLTGMVLSDTMPPAFEVEAALDAVEKVLLSDGPRAAILLGESGCGKTAIVNELARRLHDVNEGRPWRVLRVSPSDVLAGTTYLGEWQTKLRNLVNAVRWPKRVVVYIPNIHELTDAGRSAQSDSNVGSMLAPHIENGEITILGETSPEAFAAGLGAVGSVRRLFSTIDVPSADEAKTRRILSRVADEAAADWSEIELGRFLELGDFYLTGTVQPGRAIGLFRRVLEAHPETRERFSARRVLETISASTGIPVNLLDDRLSLDLSAVRAFFEHRVMGQAEAQDAVIDLVTLVKAGLTDPGKPFGVLFFVGPTGVGKTELARALAEHIFGDAARLVRFDMSEFSTYDAFERLIGRGAVPGLLTSAVREKPLSVILLDEIEKAHVNVFDICLQIFDAGRLTDAQGRTADFRRSIIILTSNIGSAVPTEASFGFGGVEAPPPDREETLKDVHRYFRPEFLNRLDRIVVFKPLAVATAEKIAQREVAAVVERSGISRRALAVDIDPSVISLLLRTGYSPAFGARPLKRTVERVVLLPVARAIATGKVVPGSVLRLTAKGEHVEVTVAAPEGDVESGGANAPAVDEIAARTETLLSRLTGLGERSEPLAERKSDLVGRTGEGGFWADRGSALEVLDEIHRLEGVLGALDTLEKRLVGFERWLTERPPAGEWVTRAGERLVKIEEEAARVEFLLGCRDARELGDALVTISLVKSSDEDLEAVERIAGMYAGLAKRRGLDVDVLDDRRGGEPFADSVTLAIDGAGAFGLLHGKAGLHHVSITVPAKNKPRRETEVVRVEVLPVCTEGATPPKKDLKVEVSPLKGVAGRMGVKPRTEVSVLHLPSMTSVRAWNDAEPERAAERVLPLLAARRRHEEEGNAGEENPVIRQYTLGPSPQVRDRRSGRSTPRLDRVLAGDLDLFLKPSP